MTEINDRILRLPEVIHLTGKSRATIYVEMGVGSFPKSVAIGARAVGWLESDIQNWIDSLTAMGE